MVITKARILRGLHGDGDSARIASSGAEFRFENGLDGFHESPNVPRARARWQHSHALFTKRGKRKPRLLAEPGSLNDRFVVPSAIGQLGLGLGLAPVLVLREQVRLVALVLVLVQRRQER